MEKIELSKISIEEVNVDKNFFVANNDDFLFSCPYLKIEEQELDILRRWGNKYLLHSKNTASISNSSIELDSSEGNVISASDISKNRLNTLIEQCIEQFKKSINSLHIFYTLLKNKTIKDISFAKDVYLELLGIINSYEKNIIFFAIQADMLLNELSYLKMTLFSTIYSVYLGISYKLNSEELFHLFISSIMADIGKQNHNAEIFESDTISHNADPKDIIFKQHCKESFIYLQKNFTIFSNDILRIIFLHHFKPNFDNGSEIKKDMKIPLESKIINICQTYFLLLFLKKDITFQQIIEYLKKRKDEFEKELLENFTFLFGEKVSIGTFLKLSNNDICIVFSGSNKNNDFSLLNLSSSSEKNEVFQLSSLKKKNLSIQIIKDQKKYFKQLLNFKVNQ